jgi:TATA-binding protein-associated factor Taf7
MATTQEKNAPQQDVALENEKKADPERGLNNINVGKGDQSSVGEGEDILAFQDLDPALNMKMHLVNNVRE